MTQSSDTGNGMSVGLQCTKTELA